MSDYKTEQESFWAGDFGNEYIHRNFGPELLASNLALFSKALSKAARPDRCIEFGANIGMNLRALRLLFPQQEQFAIEINESAVAELGQILPPEHLFHQSILEFDSNCTWDLVLIKGVLIHINPEYLPKVYERLHRAMGRYLLICEYYNPSPVALTYRGHSERLYKRDFCGEIMGMYPDLRLIDYGFCYHRDPNFPQDDATWFLLEKLA